MESEEYVSACRKIIPPNLNHWVLFRHGTVFVLDEQEEGGPAFDLPEEAVEFLSMHGPVVPGTPSGDFDPRKLKDDLGWLVLYSLDGIFNFVPQSECPEDEEELAIGLIGRQNREKDSQELEIVHVEQPDPQKTDRRTT